MTVLRMAARVLGLAALALGAVSCSDNPPPGGGTPAVKASPVSPTPIPTATPEPAGEVLVLALQVGSESAGGRSYPVVEVVSVEPATGRRAGWFQIGGRDEFLSPGMVFVTGREVLTVSERRIARWSLDGRELGTILRWEADQRPTTAVLSHDGQLLAVGWEDADLLDRERGELLVLDSQSGQVVLRLGMDVLGPALGAWPAPAGWHADKGGLELFGYAHRDGPGVFASVRLDGRVETRGAVVAGVEPGGRLLALAPGGWAFACEGLGLAAEELVFAEPVSGREAGRIQVEGFALMPEVFSPAGTEVLLRAVPLREPAGGPGTCWDWSGGEWWLYRVASGALEPVADAGALQAGWLAATLPAVPTAQCPADERAAWPGPPWRMWCPEPATVSVAGQVVGTAREAAVAGVGRR